MNFNEKIIQTMKLKQKPLALVCYLCGRQFGTFSLKIHLKTCKQKFEVHQSKQSIQSRIKLPEQPPLLQQILQGRFQSAKQYNEYALNFHKYHILPACPYCQRTFHEDSLQVHQKVCSKKPKQTIQQYKTEKVNQIVKMPRTLVCCVCGRQFGVSSLKIHYPQCLQKFRIEEQKKPKQERRLAGVFDKFQLQQVNYKQDWTYQQIKQFNEKATQKFENHTKIHCKGCKRKFMPEAYNHHLRNCQLHNMPIQKGKQEIQAFKEVKMPKVLVCHICGMQFGVTSLLIHQKACKLKFLNNQKLKPVGERRVLPQLSIQDLEFFDLKSASEWDQEKINKFNKIASEIYQKRAMQKCKFCNRTFRQEAFEKHFNYCSNQQKKKQQKRKLEQRATEVQFPKRKLQPQIEIGKIDNFQDEKTSHKLQLQFQTKQRDKKEQKTNQKQKPKDQLINKMDQNNQPQVFQINLQSDQKNQEQTLMTFNKGNNQRITKICQKQEIIKTTQFIQNENRPDQLFQKLSLPKQKSCQRIENKDILKKINKDPQVETVQQINCNKIKQTIQKEKSHQEVQPNQQNLQVQLIGCKKCGRKFFEQRLLKHESVCKGIQKFKILTKKPSFKKVGPNKQLNQVNRQQQPVKGVVKNHKIHKNTLQNKDILQNQKKIDSKQQQKTNKLNRVERIDENFDKNSRNKNNSPLHNFKQEFKQFDEDAIFQSVKCKTCNRNFRLDRIQVHQRICQNTKQNCIKMKPHLSKKKQNELGTIQKSQSLGKRSTPLITHKQSKQKELIVKTKYTQMLKQIKSRRVKDSDIDHQLEVQLNQFTEQKGNTKQNDWNFTLNKIDDVVPQLKEESKIQQDNFVGQPVVGKWKKKRRPGY